MELFKESYELSKEIDNKRLIAYTLGGMGFASLNLGDLNRAEEYFNKSLEVCKKHGVKDKRIITLEGLSRVEYERDNCETAKDYLIEAIQLTIPLKTHGSLSNQLTNFADILLKEGEVLRAVEIFALSKNHPDSRQATIDTASHLLTKCRDEISDEMYKKAEETGKSSDLYEVAREILENFEE